MRQHLAIPIVALALVAGRPSVGFGQTSAPSSKGRQALFATLGAVAGAGLGALWITQLCPTGSDSPSLCIGPPIAFVVGGAWGGFKLGERRPPSPHRTGVDLTIADYRRLCPAQTNASRSGIADCARGVGPFVGAGTARGLPEADFVRP